MPSPRRPAWARLFLPAALLVALLPPAAARAEGEEGALDRVFLTNGNHFDGRILHRDAEGLVLQFPSGTTGGGGTMRIPRQMIARIEQGCIEGRAGRPDAAVRDRWYLLRSGGRIIGTRHLLLRTVRAERLQGWHLEEEIHNFPDGRHVPSIRSQRTETVDLAFFPARLHYREVSETSAGEGPRRSETAASGRVVDGVWEVLAGTGRELTRGRVEIPPGTRARLGMREHLLRRREVGLQEIRFLEPAEQRLVAVRAGYTALDLLRDGVGLYDEFVWEEDGVRLVSLFQAAEVLEEWVADGVVAIPCTAAQAEAAAREALGLPSGEGEERVTLPEVGVSFLRPGATWTVERTPPPPSVSGWRRVALLESRVHVAYVRVEWDPDGALAAPGPAEAEARLLLRLRAACPDLSVTAARSPLEGREEAWRMELTGTLRGERVRTTAVVLDRGTARVLFLVACPEVSWPDARPSLESFIASIERL